MIQNFKKIIIVDTIMSSFGGKKKSFYNILSHYGKDIYIFVLK